MASVLDFFISPAYAQTTGQGSALSPIIMIGGLFVIMYFMVIRPQNKKQKEHREMVAALASGDEVVTAGGVLGRVTTVGEQFVEVEIADNVKIKVQRHTVSAVLPKGTIKSA